MRATATLAVEAQSADGKHGGRHLQEEAEVPTSPGKKTHSRGPSEDSLVKFVAAAGAGSGAAAGGESRVVIVDAEGDDMGDGRYGSFRDTPEKRRGAAPAPAALADGVNGADRLAPPGESGERPPSRLDASESSEDELEATNRDGYARQVSRRRGRRGNGNRGGNGDDVRIQVEEGADGEGDAPAEEPLTDIPREIHKTVLMFLFFCAGTVATTTSLALTHERVPNTTSLPDIFLDNIKYQHWGLDASEIILMLGTMASVVLMVFHGNRFVVVRRVFFLGGLHYFYRAITMCVTVLPKPDKTYTCAPKLEHVNFIIIVQRVVKLLSGFGLSINGEHIYCGDYIYSGHTMTMVMCYLIIHEYSPRRWYLFHWAAWCLTALGIIVLLLARGHYSIDVIIAYWITTRLWWVYHTLANNPSLIARENKENFLDRFWWWFLFRWLEGNVKRPLPRHYNWPVPDVVTGRVVETWGRIRARRAAGASDEEDGSSEPAIPEGVRSES